MPEGTPTYVEHPLLEPGVIEDRPYQTALVEEARDEHTLVSLPTGLGKTTVSLRVTADRLYDRENGRALLLAPTKPLVEQHAAFYRRALAIPDEEIVVFTGETRPDERAALWAGARVVVATPQVIENDLVGNRIGLADVIHCTFDECHRASGDYPYTYIAERYHADATDPLVTGMSASPGDDAESILQVCRNLGIQNVAVRTEDDPAVAAYTYDTDVEWRSVELPETVLDIRDALTEVIEDRLETLAELGVTNRTSPDLSQQELNTIRARLQRLIDDGESEGFEGMSVHAEVMKLRRAVELVETQSVDALRRYFERQENAARSSGASKATQRFVSDPRVKRARRLAADYDDLHPKFRHTRMLLAETLGIEDGERVIVFTESRDTAEALTDFLGEHFDTRRFVGQGDREGSSGMTQREQQEVLEAFREGAFEVLVSTSVAEEGLDVPEVDLVLFFEPVPTAIRSVQRKGRTGRQTEGRVVVLMAEDTRDEAYFWISRRREREMEAELETLQAVAEDLEAALGGTQEDVEAFLAEADGRDDGAKEAQDTVDGTDRGEGDGGTSTPGQSSQGSRTSADGRGQADRGQAGQGQADRGQADRGQAGQGQAGLGDFGGDAGDGPEADAGTDGNESPAETRDDEPTGEDLPSPEPGEETVEIVVDQRELDSPIARDLSTRDGIETRLETLAVGDYVLSDRVAVERKTHEDFLDSLLEGERSLFEQARDLTRHYPRSVLVLEGEGDLYAERDVHPNAIRGALASLAVDFGLSVLFTRDAGDTADLLETIATREQTASAREVRVHGEKAAKTLAEQQEYVVASIADIGPVTARSLLSALGSVEAVLTADEEELLEVEGVGEVTAERIREVAGSEYDP
ncbi:MAG: ERCC4 domain-containing protein [Halodesulfurarchaeum sp.]